MTEGLFKPVKSLVRGVLGSGESPFVNIHGLWVRNLQEMHGLCLYLDHLSFW